MTAAEIIDALREKLAVPGGRHLYGVVGAYPALAAFGRMVQQATDMDGQPFPPPVSVNDGILDAIPDDEFRRLVRDEAQYPEPAQAHVKRAFERFLRSILSGQGLVILGELELLWAYDLDFNLLRTLAVDANRVLLLLPGRRSSSRIMMFPETNDDRYTLPTPLIAENHLWHLSD